ncbi:hypothetical protein N9N28_08510 [Rubripirellula amarantea]|nr:hypothetical protein [Rubripirellula amarantea]
MQILSRWILLFLLTQSQAPIELCADESVGESDGAISQSDARSYFEGWGANVSAIRSHDVAAKYSSHTPYPDGRVKDVGSVFILRADFDTKQYLRIVKITETITAIEGKESRSLQLFAEGINDRESWYYGSDDASVSRFLPAEHQEVRKSIGIEDLQMIGLQPFSGGYRYAPPHPGDFVASYFSNIDTPRFHYQLSSDNSLVVTHVKEYSIYNNMVFTTKWMIDGEILMPDRRVSLFKDRGVTVKQYDELYTWKKNKEIYVIESLFGDTTKSMPIDDTYKNYKVFFDWKFGWRKLNVPVGEIDFAVENYDSAEEIEAAIKDADSYLKTVVDEGE